MNKTRLMDVLQERKWEYFNKYGKKNPKFWDKEGWRLDGIISALAWCKVFVVDDNKEKEYLRMKKIMVADKTLYPHIHFRKKPDGWKVK